MTVPELSPWEQARLGYPHAPESLRERVAAALAEEDQRSLLSGPLGWPETQRRWPDACGKYRSMADAVLAVVTESALR